MFQPPCEWADDAFIRYSYGNINAIITLLCLIRHMIPVLSVRMTKMHWAISIWCLCYGCGVWHCIHVAARSLILLHILCRRLLHWIMAIWISVEKMKGIHLSAMDNGDCDYYYYYSLRYKLNESQASLLQQVEEHEVWLRGGFRTLKGRCLRGCCDNSLPSRNFWTLGKGS